MNLVLVHKSQVVCGCLIAVWSLSHVVISGFGDWAFIFHADGRGAVAGRPASTPDGTQSPSTNQRRDQRGPLCISWEYPQSVAKDLRLLVKLCTEHNFPICSILPFSNPRDQPPNATRGNVHSAMGTALPASIYQWPLAEAICGQTESTKSSTKIWCFPLVSPAFPNP